ncbi:MAG TPA: LLM class flavin-dependent oxidoreductase [Rhodospirillaceae bacterium]|nr:LLM class flavin-dependent oxidoreductase [Rhodospirillaceae bacterium]
MPLSLSVLDQSPVRSGATALDAIEETVTLAQAAEACGYARYWLAEHHGTDGLAGCSPEVLLSRIGAVTREIRIGSGGVMLSHYSPLKVAENFALLSTMYPGRVDLGLGRAPGGDQLTAKAMLYGSRIGVEYYPAKVLDLKAFLYGSDPANKSLSRVRVTPRPVIAPEMWLLGSSADSATLAAQFGLPFSFAHFINSTRPEQIIEHYRQTFSPSDILKQPQASICVFAICAETQVEADHLSSSGALWRVMLEKGTLGPFPSPEEAEAYPYTETEKLLAEAGKRRGIVGDPATVKASIEAIAASCKVNEVMVVTICHDIRARLRSYELIASAFDLKRGESL